MGEDSLGNIKEKIEKRMSRWFMARCGGGSLGLRCFQGHRGKALRLRTAP